MERRIVAFHQDEDGHWIADLSCGHGQHFRHEPPWMLRPWVLDAEARDRRRGTVLDCKICDEIGLAPPSTPPRGG